MLCYVMLCYKNVSFLSLLKGSLSSKSYTCRYATSGSDNLSSYLIILNVIETHTSIF